MQDRFFSGLLLGAVGAALWFRRDRLAELAVFPCSDSEPEQECCHHVGSETRLMSRRYRHKKYCH